MAARVTKMFLQNCVQDGPAALASDKPGLKSKSSAAAGLKKTTHNKSKKFTHKSKKTKAAPQTVRALDAARKEQQQADQTKANVKKLTTRTTTKSQRLMAQVSHWQTRWSMDAHITDCLLLFFLTPTCRFSLNARSRFDKLRVDLNRTL